jgi:hypothetical protein
MVFMLHLSIPVGIIVRLYNKKIMIDTVRGPDFFLQQTKRSGLIPEREYS